LALLSIFTIVEVLAMARSAARTPVLAIFGALVVAIIHQLQSNAFVSSPRSAGIAGRRAHSRVIRSASQAEIAEAERHLKLVMWAAKKAAEEGMPQAAMMQAKADKAVQALEALKQAESGTAPAPVAAAPVAAAPAAVATIQSPIAPSPATAEEITELDKRVKLLTWAAKKAAEEGMPQAPAAQLRADQAIKQLAQLKEQQEAEESGRPVTIEPVYPMPVAPVMEAPVAPVAAPAVSMAEIAKAEKHAKLVTWAAKKAAEEGMPQATMMQAKADQAVQALAALKEAPEQQEASKPAAVPVPSPEAAAATPAATVPVAPSAPASAPSQAELEQVKKEMKLLLWAAKTTAEQGMPQADMMKNKADAKVQEYERMMQMMQQPEPAR